MAKPRRQRNPHVGGEQIPLLTPDSSWVPPTTLPDLTGKGKVEISLDVETRDDGLAFKSGPGWTRGMGYVCGVAVAWDGGRQSLYAPIRHPDSECMPKANVAAWLKAHLSSPDVTVVFHNGPYDIGWLGTDLDLPPPAGPIEDTGGMAYMVDENRLDYRLDALCRWQGVPGKDESLLREAAAAYGRDPKIDLWRLPARYVGGYAQQDPAATLGLAGALRPLLAQQQVERAYRTEMDLIPLVVAMQRRGVRINVEAAELAAVELDRRRDLILAELADHLGENQVVMEQVRSARQLMQWFDAAGVNYPVTRKTELGSFDKTWMRGHDHWLPSLVDRARRLHDAGNKFVRGFLLGYAHNGRLHASVSQFRNTDESGGSHGTVSHRFAYADPPLQQMPARDEDLSGIVRGAFEPEPGEMWLSADYSQQEYRLIVHYAAAMGLRGADRAAARYNDDPKTDFHNYVAEITGLDRKPAKDSNFAKAYGAAVPKFALMIGKSEEEAAAIYEQYDRELPFVSLAASETERLAQRRGYIRLMDGARVHFDFWESYGARAPEGFALTLKATTKERALAWAAEMQRLHGVRPRVRRADTRKALNRLIQGGAARQTKMAMLECWRAGIVPLLQMHDELAFSVATEDVGKRVADIMRGVEAARLRVPMLVDCEYGPTWGTARKVKATKYGATWAEALALRQAA